MFYFYKQTFIYLFYLFSSTEGRDRKVSALSKERTTANLREVKDCNAPKAYLPRPKARLRPKARH